MAFQVPPVAFIALAGFIVALIVRASRRRSLKFLRGPDAPSKWLGACLLVSSISISILFHEMAFAGNEHQLFHQTETGYLDFQWMREYGSTWRIRTFFGVSDIYRPLSEHSY